MTDRNTSLVPEPDRPLVQGFLELVGGIDKDNPAPADIQALREMLRAYPDLWRIYGDLAQLAVQTLIQGLDAHPHIAESLKCAWHAMKDDFDYSAASLLERPLIEQVILCWLNANIVAAEYNVAMTKSLPESSIDHWERRLSAANRRLRHACESLAHIRKFARSTPALQVNIAARGGQQINRLDRG
jgi:hypothetical protein